MVIDPNVSLFPVPVFTPVVLMAMPIVIMTPVVIAVATMIFCVGRTNEPAK